MDECCLGGVEVNLNSMVTSGEEVLELQLLEDNHSSPRSLWRVSIRGTTTCPLSTMVYIPHQFAELLNLVGLFKLSDKETLVNSL